MTRRNFFTKLLTATACVMVAPQILAQIPKLEEFKFKIQYSIYFEDTREPIISYSEISITVDEQQKKALLKMLAPT